MALHIRGPGLEGRRIFQVAQALKDPARSTGSVLLVNDRVDVALALDLDGVHLGQRSLLPDQARGLLGEEKLVGVSTHSVSEARDGDRLGASYLLVGTLFSTPSHPDGPLGGIGRVEEVVKVTDLPLLGIGGITPPRVREVMRAGARGVAVRGGIWEAADPAGAVASFLGEIKGQRGKI